ncbi:hypothetical protein GOB93_15305 [Acetobacter musti]|uniref:YfhO family protein n=1 Tax=Acetobacter musti TaxID=864732 RepID=A0ABX0JRP0_9PROT|nr:hypothetical protein [Acetobacter musti]NHN85997.1 hypothetical protein [Acetobacter musti]
MRLNKIWSDNAAFCLIILLPVLVHALGLSGILSPDPLHLFVRFGEQPRQILDGSPGWVDPNAGATTEALGALAARQWLSGHIPWWDTYSGMGMPLAAEMQSSALFFPFILLLIFKNGLLYLKIAVQIATGLAMFGLAREMRLSILAATTAALLDEFSGTLAWFAHGPIMPLPFLPMLLWGVMRCCRMAEDGILGGWALVALALAGSLFAGFPETAYMNGLLVLVIAIWRVITTGKSWPVAVRRIAGGGLLGLALSAPAWIPFAEALPLSFLGQNQNFHDAHLLRSGAGMLLFPYLLGPPLYAVFSGLANLVDLWWHTGGYCDIALVFAALVAILRTHDAAYTRDPSLWPGLRCLLFGYCVVTGLKAIGFLPVSRLLDLIPGIRQTMFYVYVVPGWWFALSLLAALAMEDLRRLGRVPARTVLAAVSVVATLGIIVLIQSRHVVRAMLPHPGYFWYPSLSVAWGILICLALAYGLYRGRQRLVAVTLLTSTIVLFFIPTLTGARAGNPDTTAIETLRKMTRFHRAITFRGFPANYGAFYGIATINYNYLPSPEYFTEELDRNVFRTCDHTDSDSQLQGLGRFCSKDSDNTSFESWKTTVQPVSVRSAFRWLEDHNVGFAVYAQGLNIWRDGVGTPISGDDKMPYNLGRDPVEGQLHSEILHGTTIRKVGAGLGTYVNTARGTLHLSVCARNGCAQADGALASAADNRVTWLTLQKPLVVGMDESDLTWKIWTTDVTSPVALWMWSSHTPGSSGPVPLIVAEFDLSPEEHRKIYEDPHFVIEQLPHAADYFTAPGCTLTPASRTQLVAECGMATTLVRNELFFPDWTATINGTPHPVGTDAGGLKQTIPLPPGHSVITFSYAPLHIEAIEILFWGSIVILLAGIIFQSKSLLRMNSYQI